jgi:hypothetical protein
VLRLLPFKTCVLISLGQEIEEKKFKKSSFLDICTGPNTFILDPKKFLRNFEAAFGTWYYL